MSFTLLQFVIPLLVALVALIIQAVWAKESRWITKIGITVGVLIVISSVVFVSKKVGLTYEGPVVEQKPSLTAGNLLNLNFFPESHTIQFGFDAVISNRTDHDEIITDAIAKLSKSGSPISMSFNMTDFTCRVENESVSFPFPLPRNSNYGVKCVLASELSSDREIGLLSSEGLRLLAINFKGERTSPAGLAFCFYMSPEMVSTISSRSNELFQRRFIRPTCD